MLKVLRNNLGNHAFTAIRDQTSTVRATTLIFNEQSSIFDRLHRSLQRRWKRGMVTITVHCDLEKIREERIKARRLGIKSDPFLVATYGKSTQDRIVLNCPEELANYLGNHFKVMRGYAIDRS